MSDAVSSTVSSVAASGDTTGLGSDNAALLAMLSSTSNVIDGSELTDTLTWNFNSGSEAFDYLAVGESLTLTYTITVTDSQGATDTQDVVITVNGTNDDPVITVDTGDSAAETLTETDSTLTASATLSVGDMDLSDAVSSTVSSVAASGDTTGLGSDNAALLAMLSSTSNVIDGSELTDTLTWSFNSGSEAFDYLAVGESLTLTYTITVTDSQGATDTQDVVITVNGTNDDPVITVDTGDSAAETLTETDSTLTALATLSVGDLDLSDAVSSTVSSVAASGDTTGLGSDNAALLTMLNSTANVIDGSELTDTLTWSFNSGGEAFDYLAVGESLTLTYTITVTDSQGATDTQDVVITINGTNDDPVITVDTGDSAAETLTETDSTLTASATLSVGDLDLSDAVSSTVSSVATSGDTTGLGSDNAALLAMLNSTANVIDGSELTDTLTWSFNSGGEAFDYLAVGESLTLTYTITATDSQGATDTQDVVITINGTNDAPVITVDTGDSVAESINATGSTLTASATLSVGDLDLSDSVASTVSSVVASGDTTGLVSDNATLLSMLNSTANVIDGSELTDILTWNFNSGSESFDYLAASESLTLTYTITATDSQGATDTQDVAITINGTNDAPTITIESGDSAAETLAETDSVLATSGTLTVEDLNLSDSVSSNVSSVVAGGDTTGLGSDNAALLAMLSSTANVIDGTELTDTLTWNFNSGSEAFDYLAVGESLTLTYTITATDSQGATDTQDVVITINGTNDDPVITVDTGDSATETLTETDSTLTASATLSVGDLDLSDAVTSTVSSVVAGGDTTGLGSDNAALLSMLSSTANVIDGTEITDTLTWSFNSGSEAFDYLAVGESLTLTYTITVTDSQGATDTQDVVITVNGTNDDPVITVDTGDSAAETLTETDSTLTASATLSVSDLDLSDAVSSTLSSVAASGDTTGLGSDNAALLAMLSSTANVIDGSQLTDTLTWNFNSGGEAFDYLAVGESLTLTYTITVTDSQGATDTQDVVITINGTNDDPVITVDTGDSATETLTETDSTLTASATLSVGDLDLSDAVSSTVSSVAASGDTTGLGSDNAALLAMLSSTANVIDGTEITDTLTWSFNSGSEAFDYLAVGESLTLTYTITVTDSQGATDTQDVVITVNGTNDDPVITVDTGDSAAETLTETDSTLTASATLSVGDLDLSDAVSSTVSSVAASGYTTGLGSDNAALLAMLNSTANVIDGTELTDTLTWSFNSGSEAFDYLAVGESLTLTYTITVTDSQGATDTQDVVITINGTNDDPVINVDTGDSAAATLTETDSTLTASATLSVGDLDLSDAVTSTVSSVAASGDTTGLGSDNAALLAMLTSTANVIDGTELTDTLTWSFNSGGEAFDYLAVGESLTLTYTITVTDSQGATDTQDVVITINGTNDDPVITVDAGDSAAESMNATGSTLTATATLSVGDLDLSDTVSSTVSSVTASGDTTGLGTNNAGLLAMLSSTSSVLDNSELSDTLTWNFNSGSEAFDYLAASESLTLTYTITVTDSQGATDTQDVVITVNGTNDAPTISIESGDSAAETLNETNTTLSSTGTLSVEDLNLSDSVSSTVSGVVATGDTIGLGSDNAALLSMLISTANVIDGTELSDTLTWNFNSGGEAFDYLAVGESLTLTYTITVTDSQGATDTQDVLITINGTNDDPVITIDTGDSAAEILAETDSTLTASATLSVGDLDLSDAVTSTVSSVAATGDTTGLGSDNAALLAMLSSTANVIDGSELTDTLAWNFNSGGEAFDYLAVGESLTLTYTITVTDSQGATDAQDVVITINGTNDDPVITIDTGDSAAETLTETDSTLAASATLSVGDLDLSDAVTSTVSSVAASGDTTGLGSDNAALLAMLSSTANVIDGTELTDTLTWNFNSGGEAFDYLAVGESLTLTYTITVTDSQGATDTQDVLITINGTNDVPVITIDTGDSAAETLTETDSTLTASATLSVGDLDLSDAVTSTVSSVTASGDTTGLGSDNAALLAMLSSTANVIDGTELADTLTWSFNSGSEAFDYLAVGESLMLTYTITVTDSQGAIDTQDVVITINGTNDAPVMTVDAGDSAAESMNSTGSPLTASATLSVGDLDLSDSVTSNVSSVSASGDTTGLGSDNAGLLAMLSSTTNVIDSAELSDTLTWSFNSGAESFDYLAAGETLTLTYTITVTDSQGATDTQDVVITVNGTNDDPTITVATGDSAAETLVESDSTLSSSGTLTVEDLNLSDSVSSTVSSVAASGDTTGLGSDNAALLAMLTSTANVIDGTVLMDTLTWSFNSATESFDYLAVGESLTLTYTITVTDSQGATDTQDVVITINGTNDAPAITVDPGDSAAETLVETDSSLTASATLSVSDLDLSDTVSSTVSSVVAAGDTTGLGSDNLALLSMLTSTANVIDGTELTDTLTWDFNSGSESFDYLASGETLTLTYTITVTDSQGATDTQDIVITINGTNDSPEITIDAGDSAAATLTETDAALTATATLSVGDLDLSDAVTSTVSSVIASGETTGLLSSNAALLSMLSSTANVIDGTELAERLTWSFNSGGETFDYLADGESLTLTYSIVVTDSQGATDTQDVVITINGTNDDPEITIDSGDSAAEILTETNTTLTASATLSVGDLDLSDTVSSTVSSVLASGDTNGLGSDNASLLSMLSSTASVIDGSELTDTLTWNFNSGTETFDYLAAGESLTLTYTITVTDSQGATDVQDVAITINGTNDDPVISVENGDSDAATLTETDSTLTASASLSVSDLDLSDAVSSNASSVVASGDTTGLGSSNAQLLAMFSSTANVIDGTELSDSLTWDFNSGSESFDYLATGETLTLTYTITVTDSQGVSDTQEVVISINGTNDTPVITVEMDDSAAEILTETDASLTTSATLSLGDLDLSDSVSSTVTGVLASGDTTGLGTDHASLLSMLTSTTNVIDGTELTDKLTWNFNSGAETFDYLATGETLTLTYTITTTDSQGSTDTQDVTITINGTNDDPVISVGTGDSAAETLTETNSTLTASATLSVDDLDLSDTVMSTVSSVSTNGNTSELGSDNAALLSMLSSSANVIDGTEFSNQLSWHFNSGSESFDYLAAGDTLTLTYTITVTDSQGATATHDVAIEIQGTNDGPSIQTGTANLDEGSTITLDSSHLSSDDIDDIRSGLVYQIQGPADHGFLQLSDTPGAPITSFTQAQLDAGLVQYVHDDSETTNDSILMHVVDGGEDGVQPAVGTVQFTINYVNDHSITGISDADVDATEVDENAAVGTSVGLTAFASDGDVPDDITYSLDNDDGGRFAIDSATGQVTVAGSIDRESDGALRNITVRATSDDGTTSTRTFSIGILDVDEYDVTVPSDVDSSPNRVHENSVAGTLVGYTASAEDLDATTNQIAFSLHDDAGGRFTIDTVTGEVSVLNSSLFDREVANSYDIVVRATSQDGSTADQTVKIELLDIDEFDVTPITDSDGGLNEVDENSAWGTTVGITALGIDGDATFSDVTYEMTDDADGRFDVDTITGQVYVIGGLDYEDIDQHEITVLATSEDGSTSERTFTIAVVDVNETPIADDEAIEASPGQPVGIAADIVLDNDEDPDGDALVIQIVSPPIYGTLIANSSGSLTYIPDPGFVGVDTFEYVVFDGELASETATLEINLTAVSDPVSNSDEPAETEDDSSSENESESEDSDSRVQSEDVLADAPGTENRNQSNSSTSESQAGETQGDGVQALEKRGPGGSGSGSGSAGFGALGQSVTYVSAIEESFVEFGRDVSSRESNNSLELDVNDVISWSSTQQESEMEESGVSIQLGSVSAAAGLVSFGYLMWAIRGGAFLAACSTSLPSWRLIDPSALLQAYQGSKGGDSVDKLL